MSKDDRPEAPAHDSKAPEEPGSGAPSSAAEPAVDPPSRVESKATDTPASDSADLSASERSAPAIRILPPGGMRRWKRFLWFAATLAALVALVALGAQVRSVTVPLLVAFILSYVLNPVVDWLEAHKLGRSLSIFGIFFAFVLLVVVGVVLVAPSLAEELAVVPAKLRGLSQSVLPWAERTFGVELPGTVRELLDTISAELGGTDLKAMLSPAGSIATTVFGGTVSALGAITGGIMVPVFVYFILRDYHAFIARARGLIPLAYRDSIGARFTEIDSAMGGFIRGQLLVAAILAVLYSIGFLIVGLPLALLVGVVAGLGNMIPYLGTAVGLVLATLFSLLEWSGPGQLALVYLVFVVVQTFEGWLLTPKIVGSSIGLSPFFVIVAVLVFGELFGFFGILVAIPLAAIVKILLRVAIDAYQSSAFFERGV